MPPAAAETPSALHASAEAWAAHWAQHWFRGDGGADLLQLDGTDAGWATHIEAYLILLDLAARALGGATHRRFSARWWLKSRGFDRAIRAMALRRLSASAPRSRVGIILEIPTPSMCEAAALVAAAGGSDVVVASADARVVPFMAARGLEVVPLVVPWREERRMVHAARRQLASAWIQLLSRRRPMDLRGRDMSTAALTALAPLARRSMPYLAAERLAVDRFLDAVEPASVAIASDQHRIGRLVVAAARRREIRSVVLQHGLPQSEVGYVPVVADFVAAWSASSADWLVNAGCDPERLAVLGNPRLDDAPSMLAVRGGPPRVLLALSPTAVATNAALVRDVLSAVGSVRDASLVIKLHPGQSDWSFVDPLVRASALGSRVTVRRHEPLQPLLADATAVIVHRSSVAVEAFAAGRPVVVHRAGDEPTTADLELADVGLAVTGSVAALATLIADVSDPRRGAEYLASRRPAIERVTGPLDGASADRIARFLLAGAE